MASAQAWVSPASRVLVGWEGLAGRDGTDLPFSADRVLEVVNVLPGRIVDALLSVATLPAFADALAPAPIAKTTAR